MKQFTNITTLIFDFGGVIIDLDLERCIQQFKDLGVENFENYLGNFGQKGFFLDFEKGLIDKVMFRNEIRNLATLPLNDEQIDRAWCSFLVEIPTRKIEILMGLKNKFRLLLLSNTNPLHIDISAVIEFGRFGLTVQDLFEKTYYSYEMKMVKPHPEIFEALLADAGVNPQECLFLDDGPRNIEQANKLGIQTYLVEANENLDFLLEKDTFI
jgi:glucose-1-phosphatase